MCMCFWLISYVNCRFLSVDGDDVDNLYYGNVHKIVNEWELTILKEEGASSRRGQEEEGKGMRFSLVLLTLCLVHASAHMIQKSPPVTPYSPGEAATPPDLGTLPKRNRKQQLLPKA